MKIFITTLLSMFCFYAVAEDGIHRIKCITLNDDYKPDGGSFSVKKAIGKIGGSDTVITEKKNVSFLDDFKTEQKDIVHTLCKQDGKEKSSEYENSYEICGFQMNLVNKEGASLVISSSFNIDETDCQAELPQDLVHKIRSYLIKGFAEEARLKAELSEKKVGHIFFQDKRGQKVIKRIQCGSESDNRIKVKGANR